MGRLCSFCITAGLLFASALAHAEGYGLMIVKDEFKQPVSLWAFRDGDLELGTLLPGRLLPLAPGGHYVFSFADEAEMDEECPFHEVAFKAVHSAMDVELPFTYRVDYLGEDLPIQKVLSPVGHAAWIEQLKSNNINLFFKNKGYYLNLTTSEILILEAKTEGGNSSPMLEGKEEAGLSSTGPGM